jgi:SAM-dependent methyltransferase
VVGVAHRLRQLSLRGGAVQGSILAAPFPDGSFDYVVSIGCLHHTGNMPLALAETARLLRPGGRATLMSYNATSYWRWWSDPGRTCAYAWSALRGDPSPLDVGSIYDLDTAGKAAPETVLVSKAHFARLLSRHFRDVSVARANVRSRVFRRPLLALLGPVAGLDLYAQVTR